MIFLISSVIYLAITFTIFRILAPRWAWRTSYAYNQDEPDSDDKFWAAAGALCYGLTWPVCLPIHGVVWAAGRGLKSQSFWDEPEPLQNPIVARRERKVARQAQEIKALRASINESEREAGIELSTWD